MTEFDTEALMRLEEKIAYQDATIAQLNEVVVRQQRDIDDLRAFCKALTEQFRQVREQVKPGSAADERPPHY